MSISFSIAPELAILLLLIVTIITRKNYLTHNYNPGGQCHVPGGQQNVAGGQ